MQETRENKTEYDTHLQNYAAIHLRAKARRFLAENFLKIFEKGTEYVRKNKPVK